MLTPIIRYIGITLLSLIMPMATPSFAGEAAVDFKENNITLTQEQADKSICAQAKHAVANNTFEDMFINDDEVDVNNDGVLEKIVKITQGTAHIESISAYDRNQRLVFSPKGAYDWNGSLSINQDVILYAGYYYFALHDSGVPVQIVRSNSDYTEKVVCAVTNVRTAPYLIYSADDMLCKNIPSPNNKGKSISSTEVSIPSRSATPYAIVYVDFNNDGTDDTIVKIEYASGAGAGCDAEWHDVLDENNQLYKSHPGRDVLLALQDVDYSQRHPARCGKMNTNWLKYNGQVLMERTFYGAYSWSSEMKRQIYKISNKSSKLLCEFEHRKIIEY